MGAIVAMEVLYDADGTGMASPVADGTSDPQH